jgi:predicted O-methyltransferase YrrM
MARIRLLARKIKIKIMMLKMRGNSNTEGLIDLINYIPDNLTMAEVGCYAGESTKMFLESNKVNLLYAIDIWEDEMDNFKKIRPNHDFSIVEKTFDESMKEFNVKKLKMYFSEALESLPTLDFIYIDANHDYEFVKDDITNGLKKVKDCGIISGHDYNNQNPGVIRAVNEFFGEPDVIFSDSSWLVKLNKKT